jgi:hypothetical protein
MWGMGNVTAVERQWAVAGVPWVLKGPLIVGAVIIGGTSGLVAKSAIRLFNLATKPLFWAGVNVYQEAQDIRSWMRGEDMSWQLDWKGRPIKLHPFLPPQIGNVIPIAFPYLDFSKSSSSGVGGPGEIPNLHRPPSIEETGKLITNPPMVGDVASIPSSSTSNKSGKRRKPCPPGYRWNGRRCVRKG